MKQMLNNYRHSRIVQKIVKRILLIEVISLILTFLLSYTVLWPRLSDNAVMNAVSASNEIASQIDTSLINMTDFSQFLVTSKELRSTLGDYYASPDNQNFNRVCLTINDLISSMSFVRGVVLEEIDGTRFHSVINIRDEEFALLDSELYQDLQKHNFWKKYSSIYTIASTSSTYGMAYMCNYLIGTKNYTLTLFYNVNSLVSMIEHLSEVSFNSYALTDFQGNQFLNTENFQWEHTGQETAFAYSSSPYEKNTDGYYFYNVVDSTGWNMVSFIDNKQLNATFMEHFLVTLLLCLISCTVTVLLIIPAIFNIIQPIRKLNQTMQVVAAGDLNCYSDIKTDDEIGDLSNVYNMMIDNLNQHIESLVDYKGKEAKMKYNLLIAQIDSHFIYNTMSIINSFARRGRTEEIISMNTALIKILQNCLRVRDIDVTDTISQEIDIVKQYWLIENMRDDNHAELIFDIPEEYMDILIPKNLIQPIVENCLFHGLVDPESGIIEGTIKVFIEKSDRFISISIADNGIGIPDTTLHFLNQPGKFMEQLNERGKHIGLSNIRQRLEYIYQGNAEMKVESRGGTIVTIILPLIYT